MEDPVPSSTTDHDVSDPGVTLVRAITVTVGAVALVAVSVAVLRRRRRSKASSVAGVAIAVGPLLDQLKAVARRLLERVLD